VASTSYNTDISAMPLSATAMMTPLKQTLLEVTKVVNRKMAAHQCKSKKYV